MTLADPTALWWLAAVPLLVWLALPPRPRTVAWTPHLAEWQRALAGLRRRPRRQSSLRLLLLLIACVLAVIAHARPATRAGDGPDRLVVLLDASASMGARSDGDGTAFDVAMHSVRERLATLPPHVDVTVLRCGGPLLRRHGASARALHDLGAPEGALLVDFEALAAAAVRDGRTAVWTLTDGQANARVPATGASTFVGRAGDNAAIAAVRTVDHWPLPSLSLAVDVVAFTAAAVDGELHVRGAVTSPASRNVHLVPGEITTLEFDVERTIQGGELEVRIDVANDSLPADDRWCAVLPPLPAPRIAVLADAEAGPFVHVAAQALAEEVSGTVVDATAGAEVGLLITDGGTAAIAPGKVRALCFGTRLDATANADPWLEPGVADWARDEQLTAGLDLSELVVHAAYPGTLPAGEPFVWARDAAGERVPLAVLCVAAGAGAADDRTASLHFAFRLQDSNLALLPAFPQLLRRAFVRAHGRAALPVITTPTPTLGEQDLRTIPAAADRPLPAFATAPVSLAAMVLLAGLLALVARAFVR